MPDNVTNERRQMAALFGAEVIDSPGALGSNGAIALAKHLVAKDARFVMPYQYGNEANPRAHYETTGPEILADCPEIDVFVAGLGTSGTLMGVSRFMREQQARRPDRRRGATPRGAASRACGRSTRASCPRSSTRRSSTRSTSSRIATPLPRSATSSSGRGSSADRRAARCSSRPPARPRLMTSGTIVALLPDGGWKYLSAGTFARDLDEMAEDLEGGVNWW